MARWLFAWPLAHCSAASNRTAGRRGRACNLWPYDLELRAATGPAMTGIAGWAAELIGVMVADIADRMLPERFSASADARPAIHHVSPAIP